MADYRRGETMTDDAYNLECSICVEQFNNPKFLPCDHTFCLDCLVEYGRHKKPCDELLCPICRKKFWIPAEGLQKLPNNYFVQQSIRKQKQKISARSPSATSEITCDLCSVLESEDTASLAVTGYCMECEQNLCTACTARHKRQRMTQNHEVVKHTGKSKTSKIFKAKHNFCDKHSDKLLELYCCDCKMTVCLACFVSDHNGHNNCDVRESIKTFNALLEDGISKLCEYVESNDNELSRIAADREDLLQQISFNEQMIVDQCNKLRNHIDLHGSTIFGETQ